MEENLQIVYLDDSTKAAKAIIGEGLTQYNRAHAGDEHALRLCYVVQAPGGDIVGGITGVTFYDWLYIELLWVKDELRGRGYGRRLLRSAEQEGRRRGAKNAFLDTFSFQAPEFYRQHGYQVFGELDDFPPGHKRLYFRKKL